MDVQTANYYRGQIDRFMKWYGLDLAEWEGRADEADVTSLLCFMSGSIDDIGLGVLHRLAESVEMPVGLLLGTLSLPPQGLSRPGHLRKL